MTIVLIAAAAAAAVTAYRRHQQADPARASAAVTNIRQSTSVVLALGDAVWAVLDALQLLFRRTGGARTVPVTSGAARFGQQTASEVGSE